MVRYGTVFMVQYGTYDIDQKVRYPCGMVLQYDSWYGKERGTILFGVSRYGTVCDDTVWHWYQ
jgi:hypothetical protein